MGTVTRTDDNPRKARTRTPTNWPTAALGIGLMVFLAFVAWLCSGLAQTWISTR